MRYEHVDPPTGGRFVLHQDARAPDASSFASARAASAASASLLSLLSVALGATVYTFDIQLSHVDRGIYEPLALRVARHPSETEEYLLTRVLAFCLEYGEGLAFSRGLAEPDEPALALRDLTGALRAWIDVGAPDAARLHRASKAAPRVAVYTHHDPERLRRAVAGERIHRGEQVELYAVDRELLASLAARLDRRMAFDLSVTEGHLYVTLGDETLVGEVVRHPLVGDGRAD